MAYPSTVGVLTNPSPSDKLSTTPHSTIEINQNTEITAIETFVGTLSSVAGTLVNDIRAASSNGGGHVQSANKGGTGQTGYTKGDLLVASSSSVLGKLGIGTDTQILIADSTQSQGVKWGNNNGAYGLITSVTLSGAASQMALSGMSTASYGFLMFEIVIESFAGVDEPLIQFNTDTGSNYSGVVTKNLNGTVTGVATSGIASLKPGGGTTHTSKWYIKLSVQNILAEDKLLNGQLWNTGQSMVNAFGGRWNNTAANITGITVAGVGSQNLGSGSYIKAYGIT